MGSNSEQRAIVPFRHRHDGWTPERQTRFLERLTGTGCVIEACRAVGLSTTSAYRAYHRMPDFAMYWNRALAARRPMLEDAAFERAVRGALIPLTRLGQVIGERRQYSDSLLRFLIEREDRREKAAGDDRRVAEAEQPTRTVTREQALRSMDKAIAAAERRVRAEALAFAERMEAEGKAP